MDTAKSPPSPATVPPAASEPIRLSGRRKVLFSTVILLIVALLCEIGGQAYFRFRTGQWLWRTVQTPIFFEEHPYLVGTGKPKMSYSGVSHNTLGLRGAEVRVPKPSGKIRIAALGGSTTYCAGLSDDQTWPVLLAAELGDRYEVVNLGHPGYSTVENLIQANLWLSDLEPDIAVFYEGWNDMRNIHVDGLRPDYSDFHGRSQKYHLGVYPQPAWASWLASFYYAFRLYDKVFGTPYPQPRRSEATSVIDDRAASLFGRNLRLCGAACKAQGIRCLLVPQILNLGKFVEHRPYGWMPFVNDSDVPAVLAHYVKVMRGAAEQAGISFAGDIESRSFQDSDFIDNGHFSESGSRKFAKMVAVHVRSLPAPDSNR